MRKTDFEEPTPQTDDTDVSHIKTVGEVLREYYAKVLGPELARKWEESKGEKP